MLRATLVGVAIGVALGLFIVFTAGAYGYHKRVLFLIRNSRNLEYLLEVQNGHWSILCRREAYWRLRYLFEEGAERRKKALEEER